MPDIDLDVESARRIEAYRVILDAYGEQRCACVCMSRPTARAARSGTSAPRSSLPPDEIARIAAAFPHIRAARIGRALTELPELRGSRLSIPQLATTFRLAERLDGLPSTSPCTPAASSSPTRACSTGPQSRTAPRTCRSASSTRTTRRSPG